ncbi:1-acyl-sn-glycerol-3-phosphate acyltransferase [Sporolactobacillus shoreicorticis]|uniref:Lysophospholipid acyltransferase family protein n=1 Tax=Sporolactobacillus shoreicorticis TaxID=1923877 RepID=A0ABW5RZX7_9BACL|nr:lysophospholipid acyltransferase family protein [Sporolactobacillus shoreicorticis]MCO7127046.1 1-acyl-sn-glycerol-3-phosphate acyltransferase [Sporolactobacillus shoreicorticis]
MNLYSFGKPIVKLFYQLTFKIQVIGLENVPGQGGVLICSNHLSNFDPPMVGVSLSRPLSFVAKSELFDIPGFGRLLSHLNAFPIRRGTGDRGALRLAIKLIREGHALLIFPEGHRNLEHAPMKKGLSGAGFFALQTDAVVLPCAIIGNYRFRSTMKIIFGKPINTKEMKELKLKSSEASAVIMEHIQALLDEHTGPTA